MLLGCMIDFVLYQRIAEEIMGWVMGGPSHVCFPSYTFSFLFLRHKINEAPWFWHSWG